MNQALDLNLLKVLVLINKHRQLRPVAKALGKTESAVSKYLSKLRLQLDDQLFVRGAHHLEPTEFTLKLLPQISAGLDLLDNAIARQEFVPELYNKDIRIALPGFLEHLVGVRVMSDLWSILPNAKVHITAWNDLTTEQILDNRIDIGVHYFNPAQTKTIYQHRMGNVSGAVVTSSECEQVRFEELIKKPFVLMEMKGWHQSQAVIKTSLEESGYEIDCRGTVDSVQALFEIIKRHDYGAFLPNLNIECEGLRYNSIPDEVFERGLPPVVANYKALNIGSPLHSILYQVLKRALFNQVPVSK